MTLKEDILNAETICIAGHTNPDGDAVSSTLALALAVEQLGKKPYILLEDYSDEFDVLDGRKYIYSLSYDELAPDLFIASDCGDKERLGEAAKVFDRAKKTWNIDHHVSNTSFAQVNVVEPASSSACEVVYETVKDFIKLDKNIATALYTGILTDTGGFRHNSTHKRTHEIAGILVEAGVDTPFIHNKMLMEHTLVQAKVLAQAIENVSFEGSVCISYIDSIQLEKIGAESRHNAGEYQGKLRVEHVQLRYHQILRYDEDLARNHHLQKNDGKKRFLSREFKTSECIPAHGSCQESKQYTQSHHDDGIDVQTQEIVGIPDF